ncbi:hypothetical protein BC833DRAFT_595766 [Globomyces pollinis-pini]|nr:hypothetical protein BC833DRAFT_595766 [Globomyces pollinis-pini]
MEWVKVSDIDSECPTLPPARYEHTALTVSREDQEEMWILYGAGEKGPLQDVWTYNLENNQWSECVCQGLKPSPRVIRSVGFTNNRIYIFGGGLHNNIPVKDNATYCLDLNSLFWVMVSGPKALAPQRRLGHSMTSIDSKIYLFGGMANDGVFDDLWVFDTVSNKWSQPETTGDQPGSRCAHSAVAMDHLIYIYGGMTGLEVHDSAYCLDTKTMIWSFVGNFKRRLDHAVVKFENSMYVFGGMDLSNVFNDSFQIL